MSSRVAPVADRPLLTYTLSPVIIVKRKYDGFGDTILQVDTDAHGLRWTGQSRETIQGYNNSFWSRRSHLGIRDTTVFPDDLHSRRRLRHGGYHHGSRVADVSSQAPRLGDKTADRRTRQTQEEKVELTSSPLLGATLFGPQQF